MKDMTAPIITILTPTWNRRALLPRLYDSLVSQDVLPRSFEWLVVDDGSTDGTEEYIRKVAFHAPFPIRVLRQPNGGKHRALNRGVKEIRTPWVLVIDSDDWLLPGGMERGLEKIRTVEADPSVKAIIAPLDLVGRTTGNFVLQTRTIDFADWMQQRQVGDTSIIMRSELTRSYLFPEFDGERFIAEGSVYSRMFRNGGVRLSNTRIVRGEYQPDGLSARSLALRAGSPLGALFTYRAHLQAGVKGRRKLRDLLNYYRFYWHARHSKIESEIPDFKRSLIFPFVGWWIYTHDRLSLRFGQENPQFPRQRRTAPLDSGSSGYAE